MNNLSGMVLFKNNKNRSLITGCDFFVLEEDISWWRRSSWHYHRRQWYPHIDDVRGQNVPVD